MIIARVEGGIGNQMFIYAAARALALRTGTELKLDIWNAYGPGNYFGNRFQLSEYAIAAAVAEKAEVAPYMRDSRSFYWRRKLDRRLPWGWRDLVEERALFEPRMMSFQPRRRVYLVGYWQREEYFREHAATIRRELTLKREPSAQSRAVADEMRAGESAFLHVRRVKYEHALPASYYAAALDILRQRAPRAQLYVFGDDIAWVRREVKLPADARFVEHNGEERNYEDLWLMTQCRHAIIANSSFSWWGAWLNPAAGRTVVAPAVWGYRAAAARGWLTV